MIYDLSVTINDQTVTYPTDPVVSVKRMVHFKDCGFNVSSLSMGTHSGTHVDLPLHCTQDGVDAAEVSIESFCGDAVFVNVHSKAGKPVDLDEIDTSGIKRGDVLIVRTGWEEKAGSQEFFKDFPYFSTTAVQKLIELGVKAVGTDMPSVDRPGSGGEIHRMILGGNIMIIEALVNLGPLVGKRCFFSAVPLKIKSGDGSPVRAYAML